VRGHALNKSCGYSLLWNIVVYRRNKYLYIVLLCHTTGWPPLSE